MSPQKKIQLIKIRNITIAWTLIGIFISVYDHFLLHSNIAEGHIKEYSFLLSLALNSFSGFVGGFLAGILLVFINYQIRSKPYFYGLLWGIIGFAIIFSFIILLIAIIITLQQYDSILFDREATDFFLKQFMSTIHLKNLIFWASITLLTQFTLQISEKFGPGNLLNILTGKYHIPKNEERIFMFLDLKSSTTIAEKLGEEIYHEFLQDVFADITDSINNNEAEIYQYVGDEVIISWNLIKLKNRDYVINVFFEIQDEFEKRKEYYLEKYKTIPQFKAGAHIGNAIVGEIGIIKRDITYSGDLLNTAARIQGMCNELNSKLLISGELKNYLNAEIHNWNLNSKGKITLKGKLTQVELFCVRDKR